MKYFMYALLLLTIVSCSDEEAIDESILASYMEANADLVRDEVIGCAGGRFEGLLGSPSEPTDVIYYPIEGSSDIRYFEAPGDIEPNDYTAYVRKELEVDPLFNGYLEKFNNPIFDGERWGIVTFRTPGRLHMSNPIRLKINTKPTEVNADLLTISDNGVEPTFSWEDGLIPENAIYFHVVSDLDNNLISGTYTFDREFTFYDLDNVVLNITDPATNPSLEPNQEYNFTMMGVSLDNWVNLLIQRRFTTL